ncbi:patatin-like phospholipase family protein [Caldimonas tepidiphila]|uniref:patatin-like phospholipase family protein n=1 Tax=Caldimonas tepidiphila TaxID=2315841 RepID=UPI000E5ADC71|nr:patatin-like phospholipase family protein [Caldimonas tepidiphila]
MQALRIHAGRTARQRLRERGLSPEDVRIVPAAAGGPKGLILNPLDRFVFGRWLARGTQPVHLLGASIGAWRMACACLPDPDEAFAQRVQDYIGQRYEHRPGKPPHPRHVSEQVGVQIVDPLVRRAGDVLGHPRYRLHVFTSRGCHRLLRRQCRWRTPLGYAGAFAANAVSRAALGGWLERVVFHDPRAPQLPIGLQDFRTHRVALDARNLHAALLASCSIPFWLDAVHDIPGAPEGAYWDGGLTDYHLHLDYASMGEGLVLYPHFQQSIVPGWLDKALRHRHRATARLDNVVVLAPDPQWIARALPGGKLPDRKDFKTYADDVEGRIAAWTRAVAESQRLADEFEQLVGRDSIEALPLE